MLRCLWSLWFEHLSCLFCSWHEMLALDSAMVASKQLLPMHQTWMRILNLNGGHEPGWTGAIIVVSCVFFFSQDFGSWKPLQNSQGGPEGQITKAGLHDIPLPGGWGWRARRLRLGHLRIVKTRWFVVISCHLKRWRVFQGTLVFWSKWDSKHSPCNLVFYATFVLAWLIFLPSWMESKWNEVDWLCVYDVVYNCDTSYTFYHMTLAIFIQVVLIKRQSSSLLHLLSIATAPRSAEFMVGFARSSIGSCNTSWGTLKNVKQNWWKSATCIANKGEMLVTSQVFWAFCAKKVCRPRWIPSKLPTLLTSTTCPCFTWCTWVVCLWEEWLQTQETAVSFWDMISRQSIYKSVSPNYVHTSILKSVTCAWQPQRGTATTKGTVDAVGTIGSLKRKRNSLIKTKQVIEKKEISSGVLNKGCASKRLHCLKCVVVCKGNAFSKRQTTWKKTM